MRTNSEDVAEKAGRWIAEHRSSYATMCGDAVRLSQGNTREVRFKRLLEDTRSRGVHFPAVLEAYISRCIEADTGCRMAKARSKVDHLFGDDD